MTKTVRQFVCLVALWALASTAGSAASNLAGQVTFGTVPVPGATVTASQNDKKIVTSTDPGGAYQFVDLAEGTWTIAVEMLGFEPVSQDTTVAAGAPPVNIA